MISEFTTFVISDIIISNIIIAYGGCYVGIYVGDKKMLEGHERYVAMPVVNGYFYKEKAFIIPYHMTTDAASRIVEYEARKHNFKYVYLLDYKYLRLWAMSRDPEPLWKQVNNLVLKKRIHAVALKNGWRHTN